MMNKFYILFLLLGYTINAQIVNYPISKEGNYESYISKDSILFKVGDKLTIGLPKNGDKYLFISQGGTPAGTVLTGNEVIISKLKVVGNKKRGYRMFAQFKGYGLIPVDIDIENALKVDEIEIEN